MKLASRNQDLTSSVRLGVFGFAELHAIDTDGRFHLWGQGRDPYVLPRVRDFAWLGIAVPKTDCAVASIRLILDLATVADWAEIDAVQLVTAPR